MTVDDRLISALRSDGRMTLTDLARLTGVPRGTVSSRLDQLRADGSITITAVVHPEFLGLTAFAHLAVRVSGNPGVIAEHIARMTAAAFVSAVSGEYQLIVELRLPGQPELYEAIAEIRAFAGVERINTLLYVDAWSELFVSGHAISDGVVVDERDLALITMLQADGRARFAALARAVGLSPSATRKRVGALIAAEIIRIAPVLSRSRPDAGIIAGVGLNVREEAEELATFLAADPRMIYVARTIGRYDVVATVASRTPAELEDFLTSLSASPRIAGTESWVHLRVVKERYEWPLPTITTLREHGRWVRPADREPRRANG